VRKTVGLVIGWLLAGVGAVALATMAVGAVGDQLTGDRPAPLNAAEVRQELDQAAATTTTPAATVAPPATTSTTAGDGGGSSGRGPADTTVDGGRQGPTPTTSGPSSSGAGAPAVSSQTFSLEGGTATLRFSAAGVTVVTATPKPGFRVDVEPEHGNGVRVEFESDTHRSRVSGWWDGGPRYETREDADGGGGGSDGSSHG
jgi:hypothetical protein